MLQTHVVACANVPKGGFVMAALFVFSAFSAAVSDVFISSRLFFFMSKCGHAPRWGSYTWKLPFGVVPYGGVLLAGAFALLAFLTAANAEQVRIASSSASSLTVSRHSIGSRR